MSGYERFLFPCPGQQVSAFLYFYIFNLFSPLVNPRKTKMIQTHAENLFSVSLILWTTQQSIIVLLIVINSELGAAYGVV